MAKNQTYTVTTRYKVETRSSETKTERLARAADRYAKDARKAEKATKKWQMSLGGFGAAAAGGALGFLTKKLFDVQRGAENASVQIAGVFATLNPDQGFMRSLERANDLVERFRGAAIKSPATSAQFTEVFQGAAPALGGIGLSNQDITAMISRAVPAAMAFTGGDFGQAGRDLNQMLSGQFGTDNRTFNPMRKRLLKLTKSKDTQAFNKLAKSDPKKVYEAALEVLSSMDDVNSMFAGMFDGLASSSIEYIRGFGKEFTSEIYERIKGQLSELVMWFEKNKDEIEAVARSAGRRLAQAFDLAAKGSKLLLENMRGVAAIAMVLGTAKAGSMLAGPAGSAFGAARNYVGATAAIGGRMASAPGRATRGALNFLGDALLSPYGVLGAKDAASRGSRFGRFMATVPGAPRRGVERFRSAGAGLLNRNGGTISGVLAAGGKAGVMGGFKGALGGLKFLAVGAVKLTVILLPLIVIIGMLVGMFRVLKDKSNEATMFLRSSIDELILALDMLTYQFGAGGGFKDTLFSFVDWLGTGVVGVLGIAVKGIEQLVRALSWMAAVIKGVAYGVGSMMSVYEDHGWKAMLNKDLVANAFGSGIEHAMKERREAEKKAYADKRLRDAARKKKEEEDKKNKDGQTLASTKPSVEVHIHQDIKTDADPDRIAFATGEVMKKISLRRRDTSVPLLAGVRR